MQSLSVQSRVIGLVGAVEAGVGLWYFTSGNWINGMFYMVGVAFLTSVYIRRERKLRGPRDGRRY